MVLDSSRVLISCPPGMLSSKSSRNSAMSPSSIFYSINPVHSKASREGTRLSNMLLSRFVLRFTFSLGPILTATTPTLPCSLGAGSHQSPCSMPRQTAPPSKDNCDVCEPERASRVSFSVRWVRTRCSSVRLLPTFCSPETEFAVVGDMRPHPDTLHSPFSRRRTSRLARRPRLRH